MIYQVAETKYFHKWESWVSEFDDDKELKLSFMIALTSVRSLQDRVDRSIICNAEETPSFPIHFMERGEAMWKAGSNDAARYRAVLDHLREAKYEFDYMGDVSECLSELLMSKLVLDRSGARVGDLGPDEVDDDVSFFCAHIRDADLPWDQESIDW